MEGEDPRFRFALVSIVLVAFVKLVDIGLKGVWSWFEGGDGRDGCVWT